MCPFCSFHPVAFLEISSRTMDLDANKELIKHNIILNSRMNAIHMEKAHLFRHWSLVRSRILFCEQESHQAHAKINSVTRKEKQ